MGNEPKTAGCDMTTPCGNCPFRTDVDPYIHEGRVREIQQALSDRSQVSSFWCHKTTTAGGASGKQLQHCAGAMILLEKIGEPSQAMDIAYTLGLYDPEKLNMLAPVYDSWDEMAKACDAADAAILEMIKKHKGERHPK
jgi:hypothetical protein